MEISIFASASAVRGVPWGCSSSDSSTSKAWQHVCSYESRLLIPQTRRIIRPLVCQTRHLYSKRNSKVLSSLNQATLEVGSIEEIYNSLATRLLHNAAIVPDPNSKYIVGIAGPPGAGKSTIAFEVARRLNILSAQKVPDINSVDIATIIPMDGFHLYRSQLDAMEDPKEAHARRGAPWTFDPLLLLKCLQTLKTQGSVYAPSFDHGVGDPVEEDIFVGQQFIDIDINIAMQRVVKRHISTGKTPDFARWRVEYNDRPNAELIMKSKKGAGLVIKSVDWKN